MSERPPLVQPHFSISHARSLLSAWLRRLVDLFAPAQPTDHHFMVVRPEDLLVLYLELRNFRIEAGSPPKLRRANQQIPSVITVTLYPQHISEEAFFQASPPGFAYLAVVDDTLLAPLYQLTVDPSATDLKDLSKELARQCGLSIPQHCRGQAQPQPGQWRVWLDGQPGYTFTKVIEQSRPWLKVEPDPDALSDPPVQAGLSGLSYLVFDASTLDTLDFTLPSLLKALTEAGCAPPTGPACLVPRLAPAAEPDFETEVHPLNPPPLMEPTELMTQIEAPFCLVISPTRSGRWLHACRPVVSPTGWTELWHMRLVAPGDDGVIRDDSAKIRAIWTRDLGFRDQLGLDPFANKAPEHKTDPFRASLDAADRFNLVHLTSNFNLTSKNSDGPPLVTAAVNADRLMISALGAWLDLRGEWQVRDLDLDGGRGGGLSVSEWRHRATMGRDHYVRVVYEGFLFPFGHRATLVKITERKFHNDKPGNTAYLRQRMFLVVREPIKSYGAPGLMAPDPLRSSSNTLVPVEHYLPFKTVRITTRVTPDLDDPGQDSTFFGASQSKFWPRVGRELFPFHLQATDQDSPLIEFDAPRDQDSRLIEFDAPLIFIALEVANDLDSIGQIAYQYNHGSDWDDRRTPSLAGQPVAFATSASGPVPVGSTVFETQRMTLGALVPTTAQPDLIDNHQPGFVPAMLKAEVFLPDFKYLAGNTDLAWFRYALVYLNSGIANDIEAFAELIDDQYQPKPVQLEFGSQAHRSGALLTPNMRVYGLSRTLGPAVGGTNGALAGGAYSASSLFAGMAPKLLGQFDLIELIPDTSQPTLATERLVDGTTTYTVAWEDVPLKSSTSGAFDNRGEARLALYVETVVPAGGQEPQISIQATLASFALTLRFLRVKFSQLDFSSSAGRKPDVVARLDGIEFLNELSFVNNLKDIIPLDGFCDPPALVVTNEGLTASYTLGVPNVGVGIFSLQHILLEAALDLPFTETPPGVRFNFARRESPFTLSMGPFGGGGFFALEATAARVQVLEVSLEFGAYVSMNFGVASGGVHAMGGVYIKLDESQGDKLSGYFRMGGEVDVLGLVSASIELCMALAYEASKAVGRASITVEIEIVFFSTSVSISCERKFAGSTGDPSFDDVMGPYYVHRPTGQVLYKDSTGQIFYFDPIEEDEAYRFDPVTGAYLPQPAHTFTQPVPYRPDSEPAPADAKNVYPWGDYCGAFAG